MEEFRGKRELAVIIFKALAVYSFIQALAVFAYRFPILYYKNNFEDDITIILQVVFLSTMLAVFAFIVWFMSPRIADSLFNQNVDINKEDVISSSDMHIIAFSFIGMLVIIDGLPEIVKTIFFHYQVKSLPGIEEGMAMVAERNSSLLATIIQCVLGVWLIFGSRGITNTIRKLRRE